MIPVFDGHNDLLWRLWSAPDTREAVFLRGEAAGHLDLPRMQKGGFAGGLFAIWVPSPDQDIDATDLLAQMDNPPYDIALPPPVPWSHAAAVALAQAGIFAWMERASRGAFQGCRTVAQINDAMAKGAVAGVLHMEGAEAISRDLDELHVFHALGLRSLGPVWSRPTAFGHGVPFRFPGDPDTGPGLTPDGARLVRECNALRVLLDVSHLNAAGFRDLMRLSDAPLIATHSNAHAVTPSTRNLTDWQLDAIAETDGLVGLNFATVFLRADGRQGADIGWDPMLRHLDHLLSRLGEDRVALGSDFDGATVPAPLADVAGLPRLLQAMQENGFDKALVEKIAHRNWLAALTRVWGG